MGKDGYNWDKIFDQARTLALECSSVQDLANGLNIPRTTSITAGGNDL